MFAIRVLPASQLGPDGQRLGEITIGDFTERFACNFPKGSIEQLESNWRAELRRLVSGAAAVALVHDPRFAWVFYRDGTRCFIQQKLLLHGDFQNVASRQTKTEDGQTVSEWITHVSDSERFLGA
jgi:hypothetical protein